MRLSRAEPCQHLRQRVAPGDARELLAHERIEADVQTPQAGGGQRVDLALEEKPIGRDREVVEPVVAQRRKPTDDLRQLAPHERLTPGQPHVAHPEPHEEANEALDLVDAEQLPRGEEGHLLRRHAVEAAELAGIGHAHPQRSQRPAEAVRERRIGQGEGASESRHRYSVTRPPERRTPAQPKRYRFTSQTGS